MILKKIGEEYKLYSHDSCIATTQESPHKRLSKQNCDEIFGVVDVEILSDEYSHDSIWFNKRGTYNNQEFFEFIAKKSFTEGYNKAMELNKDKLFTIEDMNYIFQLGFSLNGKAISKLEYDAHIQSLQQPTEIEVEIDMEKVVDETKMIGVVKGVKGSGNKITTYKSVPKLDGNGCLILKKK